MVIQRGENGIGSLLTHQKLNFHMLLDSFWMPYYATLVYIFADFTLLLGIINVLIQCLIPYSNCLVSFHHSVTQINFE